VVTYLTKSVNLLNKGVKIVMMQTDIERNYIATTVKREVKR